MPRPTTGSGERLRSEILLTLYRQMALIRACEEELARSHQRGRIQGACHTSVGQEAVAAGVCARLRADDVIFSTHRGHGHALAKGVPPREVFAELFGRFTGCSQGRGGSMHLFAPEIGLMGTSGIVGPCILQAAGAGYTFKLFDTDRVAVAFFGDGAVQNGAFHEGLNLASIWKLPVVFVCENNLYATEVPFEYAAGNADVAAKGVAYGLPAIAADGNDVVAVYEAAGEAVERARAGGGPTLLECKTYRTRAHAEGMGDFTYRSRQEVEEWKDRCPILRLERQLVEHGDAESGELERIRAEVDQQVEEAREFAEASPWPDPATATAHVYHEASRRQASGPAPGAVSRRSPPQSRREITWMKATLEALSGEMARNPAIFVLGEGIGKRGGNFNTTTGLFDQYGAARLRDTPICERGFVGLACGAAMTGARPVVDFMFADFVLDALGEILNQIAKMQYMSSGRIKMPLLLRGSIGIGGSSATHHSGSYYPLFSHFPGLRVVVPSTPHDAKGLLTCALRSQDPVLFLEHRGLLNLKGPVPEEDYEVELGQAAVVREGRHVTVVGLARTVHLALKAAGELEREGVSLEVIDPRTVAPLDVESILASVHRTNRLLIVDETFAPCGIGAEIAAQVNERGFDDLDAPIRRLNGAHAPTPYSPALEAAVVPGVEDIVRVVREMVA